MSVVRSNGQRFGVRSGVRGKGWGFGVRSGVWSKVKNLRVKIGDTEWYKRSQKQGLKGRSDRVDIRKQRLIDKDVLFDY